MRTKQNALLAGVAALALLAGTAVASAQQSPQAHTGAAGMSAPAGTQAKPGGPGPEQHAQTTAKPAASGPANARGAAASNGNGQTVKPPAMAERNGVKGNREPARSARIDRGKMSRTAAKTERNRPEHFGANSKLERNRTSAEIRQKRTTHTAQRNEKTLRGLQGNASVPMQGSHVNLTADQRTRIRDSVIDARGAPRAGHVDFDVRVGTLVPRRDIHVVRVPRTLVEIDPAWRGFLYFVVGDEVVIVNPHDMRIVAVLTA